MDDKYLEYFAAMVEELRSFNGRGDAVRTGKVYTMEIIEGDERN